MKLNKIERGITRYQVSFTPEETAILMAHRRWSKALNPQPTSHGGREWAQATLTKAQINDVCDALGLNGREWLLSKGAP